MARCRLQELITTYHKVVRNRFLEGSSPVVLVMHFHILSCRILWLDTLSCSDSCELLRLIRSGPDVALVEYRKSYRKQTAMVTPIDR